MVNSQNGYSANPDKGAADVATYTLDGTGVTFPGGFKRGEATILLGYVAHQFHKRVEPLHPGWSWGYCWRPIRGASALSNHASGTAMDLNAPLHPLSKSGTFNPGQQAAIRAILSELDGVIRWGGDYNGRKDEQHFELSPASAKLTKVAQRIAGMGGSAATAAVAPPAPPMAAVTILGGPGGIDGTLHPGSKGADVVSWQGELWRLGFGVGEHDGLYGPAVESATLDLQRAAGIGADGIVGNATRDAARRVPRYPKADGPLLPLAGPAGPADTVRAFQERLKARGWDLAVDGAYGPRTSSILAQFQRQAGGDHADGIGGPWTWAALWLRPVT